nr:hypothetical protein [Tanacetum cinerariifolium]
MDTTRAQQKALDDELVALSNRLKIGKSNLRLSPNLNSKEHNLQVVLDALKLNSFNQAFKIIADVQKIYMQEFWVTVSKHHSLLRFKMKGKRHTVNIDNFRDMLYIFPNLPGQKFKDLPCEEKILSFIKELGHTGKINVLFDVNVYGALLPQYLSNQAMLEFEAYKTYHAYATGEKIPKPKYVPKKADSNTSLKKSLLKLLKKSSDDEDDDDVDDQSDDDDGDSQVDDDQDDDDDAHTKSENDGTQVTGDTHVILTIFTPEAQQQSSSVSSVFISNMLNPYPDTGIDYILNLNTESTYLVDVPVTTDVEMPHSFATTLSPPPIPLVQPQYQTPVPLPAIIIKKQIKEQVKEQVTKILSRIEKLVNEQLKAEVLTRLSNKANTSHAIAVNLSELELKKILIEKMERNKSIHRSNQQKALYKALIDAYEFDKVILDTYGDIVPIKRRRDDKDDDEEPSAGSDRGSKRRIAGTETESISEPKEKTSKPTGKSSEGSKSHQKSNGKSTQAEEPIHTVEDLEEPTPQEYDIAKPPTLDRDWNKTLPAAHRPIQPWISNLAWKDDTRDSFNELMDTPPDFSAFVMNRLKVDTLTPDLLAGRKRQQFYGYAVNRESAHDVYSRHRIIAVIKLQIVEWRNYKHLDWIIVYRNDDKLYTFKEGDYKRIRLQDIEDMLLLLVQGKLTNLTIKERLALNNKDKKNRLMRIDELNKFSDGTLNDVRTALDDILKRIKMKYLPQKYWRNVNMEREGTMIQAIDKQLKHRRIMRSLEKFVGGRPYEGLSAAGKDHMIYHMMSSS